MSLFVLDLKSSKEVAVGAGSGTVPLTMVSHKVYQFTSNVNCWITQDKSANSPTASAGAGSAYIPANTPVHLDGAWGDTVAVIEDSTGGKCSLTPMVQVR